MNKSKLKTNEIDWKIPNQYNLRFGKIAVEYGFVTPEQVKSALKEQFEDNLANRHHRLLGIIFFDNGWMTLQEIEMVFNELIRRNKEYKRRQEVLNACYENTTRTNRISKFMPKLLNTILIGNY